MADDHKNCLQFPEDFETKKVRCIPIGRVLFGDFVGRIILTPQGLKLYISQSAVDKGFIILGPKDEDELIYVGATS